MTNKEKIDFVFDYYNKKRTRNIILFWGIILLVFLFETTVILSRDSMPINILFLLTTISAIIVASLLIYIFLIKDDVTYVKYNDTNKNFCYKTGRLYGYYCFDLFFNLKEFPRVDDVNHKYIEGIILHEYDALKTKKTLINKDDDASDFYKKIK